MQPSRIRELRKAKRLTLADVAARVPDGGTTAQTIGRLETGMRKLTLDWVDKIAAALEVDPGDLLLLPESGDLPVDGEIGPGGVWADAGGTLIQRVAAAQGFAVRIAAPLGRFQPGDLVICDRLPPEETAMAVGKLALVRVGDGSRLFARVAAGSNAGRYTLVPVGDGGEIMYDRELDWAAPALRLVRDLS